MSRRLRLSGFNNVHSLVHHLLRRWTPKYPPFAIVLDFREATPRRLARVPVQVRPLVHGVLVATEDEAIARSQLSTARFVMPWFKEECESVMYLHHTAGQQILRQALARWALISLQCVLSLYATLLDEYPSPRILRQAFFQWSQETTKVKAIRRALATSAYVNVDLNRITPSEGC